MRSFPLPLGRGSGGEGIGIRDVGVILGGPFTRRDLMGKLQWTSPLHPPQRFVENADGRPECRHRNPFVRAMDGGEQLLR